MKSEAIDKAGPVVEILSGEDIARLGPEGLLKLGWSEEMVNHLASRFWPFGWEDPAKWPSEPGY